jgi:prepilin-type N-terminal cleavage/methylation domain-containing protein
MRINIHKVCGFTLPELMLSMTLLAFLMVAAALGIQAAEGSRSYNFEKTDLTTRARGVLDRLSRDVRRAASYAMTDSRTVVVTMTNGDTHAYAWDGASGGNLTYSYTPNGSLVATSAVLTDKVTAFEVTDANPSLIVRIVLTGTKATSEMCISATPRKSLY